MRSWLAVFLLVLLPLQFSWAAMDASFPHAGASQPVVMVHCIHPHGTTDGTRAFTEAGAEHADCSTCHNGCHIALFNEPRSATTVTPAFPLTGAAILPASRPADLPDRPQWTARG